MYRTENLLHFIAKHAKDSCLQITSNGLKLKTRHHSKPKYKEVWVFQEGNGLIWQSIVTKEIWRICILKIYFDPICWNDHKRNLLDFCFHAVVPEIITRRIKRGKPLHATVFCYKK